MGKRSDGRLEWTLAVSNVSDDVTEYQANFLVAYTAGRLDCLSMDTEQFL